MKLKITNAYHELITATNEFLADYLLKKNKTENDIYLSVYLSCESPDSLLPRRGRYLNMLRQIELALRSQLSPKRAKIFMEQFNKLDHAEIVKISDMSIAFFISEKFAGFIYIPFPVFENAVVARSLHLKPIISWIKTGDQFYLITLSSKLCRLFKGDSFSIEEMKSISILNNETEGLKKISDKNSKHKLMTQAEEEFYEFVKNDNFPIVIGGVSELHDLFRRVNRDPDVLHDRIIGNLDKTDFENLHEKCLDILNSVQTQNKLGILAHYQEMKYCGKVLEELNQITIAAVQGRVRNLMVASDRFLWGSLDRATGRITNYIHKNLAIPEDDILDDLAEIVIARGGKITLLKSIEMPVGTGAVALLK